jgi:antitoxin (DNA-binding transcriptional repressor) of toxin-antitoxin stability system
MKTPVVPRSRKPRRERAVAGRPSVGIRELKAQASSIIHDVKGRRVTYAVTKRGVVEALIVPVDAGERLLGQSAADGAWDAWQALVNLLAKQAGREAPSAVAELARMRR